MKNKVFLVGNGINNIETTYTWAQLITDLVDYIGASGQIMLDEKPFPLLYEEIIVEAIKNRKRSESEVKGFIAERINKLQPNMIHQEILTSGVGNILTTNYDFTFEKQLTDTIHGLKNQGIVKESTYSIFRHYSFNDLKIWHIHGDSIYPGSITLGYEHYSGYLQQMRNYIVTGTGTSYKNIQLDSLMKRLKSRKKMKENHSWLDFFFLNDIYIIGLTLDFIELHLWWLLTFRQRAIITRRMKIANQIVYFYPNTLAEQIKPKLQLLKSYGVLCHSCNYQKGKGADFYKNILDVIKEGRV